MRAFRGDLRDTIDLLAFGPGQRLLAACAGRSQIDLWDAVTGLRADTWRGRGHAVRGVGFLPDGRAVVAADRLPLQLIDPHPDPPTCEEFPRVLGTAERVAVAADAPVIASVQSGGQLRVWTPRADGEFVVRRSRSMESHVRTVAISADGRRLAAAERPTTGRRKSSRRSPMDVIVVRDVESRAEVRVLRFWWGRWDDAGRLAFFPDGRRVVVFQRTTLQVWDAEADDPPTELRLPADAGTTAVAVHPGGRHLLTAGTDGSARVWDADTLAPREVYAWGVGRLGAAAFSADGAMAAVGGEDGYLVVWDVDF